MLGSSFAAELAANQQFDYVVVDCQHGLNGQDRSSPFD
jgi:2-keto-3-deoxy-L-rhamnonate aldolase RhmA